LAKKIEILKSQKSY